MSMPPIEDVSAAMVNAWTTHDRYQAHVATDSLLQNLPRNYSISIMATLFVFSALETMDEEADEDSDIAGEFFEYVARSLGFGDLLEDVMEH